ncbi:hypothetical protein RV18_GL003327 [Enterococcus termitis]|nr:hypothetical protein RV18_GL003327 [Enterococcus termitis]
MFGPDRKIGELDCGIFLPLSSFIFYLAFFDLLTLVLGK